MIIDSRYKVLEQLGTGVWATVYKVVDSRTGNLRTLKLFQHLDAHTLYEKFTAEDMHHITSLEHPNLVPVITFGNMGKHIYCVSDYYDGKNLHNYKFKLNKIDLLYDMIVQIVYALHALHLQKIFHKDIKPSNILYKIKDNNIEVKLVDYGFNKIDTDKNQQTISGTLPFMAPELYSGKDANPQSDFYSLGVTIYKIITDNLPFSVEQITAVISGNQKNFFPKFTREINPEIPISLDKFVMKLLEKNPQERFRDAQSIIAFINKIQNKNYSFSHRTTLVQSVKLNSYIVRANYAHQLTDYVPNMTSGNGKVITLIGGDGIGKDDLLTLFKYHFFTNQFYIFDYTCSAIHKDPFFALIKEFSSSTLNNERKNTIFENISIRFKKFLEESEEIANTLSEDLTKSQNDYESAKSFLTILSQEKPLIFIIRAGQYLTTESIEFVNYISSLVSDKPMLIIISVNDPTVIKGLIHSVHIKVSPLNFEEIKNYIQNLLNVNPPEEFINHIQYRSSGNPFFIREILIDLLEKKLLLKNKQLNFNIDFDNYILPEHLIHSIYNRMSHLELDTYKYLQKLSVIQTPITKELISEILKINQKTLFNILQNSINNEILIEKTVNTESHKISHKHTNNIIEKSNSHNIIIYDFTFPEVKQRLLRECSKNEKIKISEKLINYYDNSDKLNPSKDNQFNLINPISYSIDSVLDIPICKGIIKNSEMGNNYVSIRKYRMKLFQLYSNRYDQINAFDEICKILLLDFTPEIEVAEFNIRTDLLLFIEKTDLTGRIDEAFKLLKRIKPREDLFEWHYAYSSLYFRSERFTLAETQLRQALPLAITGRQQIRLLTDLSVIYIVLGQFDSAKNLFDRLSNITIDKDLEIKYFDRYGMYLTNLGKDEEAIVWYEDSINKVLNNDDSYKTPINTFPTHHITPGSLGSLYNNLGIIYCRYKMYAEAQQLFLSCKKEWEKINYDRLLGTLYNNIGDMSLRQGDTINALENFKKAENISRKIGNKRSLCLAYVNYGESNIKLGKFTEAEHNLIEAKKIISEIEHQSLNQAINNNLALAKNKIYGFHHFYNFIKSDFPDLLLWGISSSKTNNKKEETSNKLFFTQINPLIKSYLFFLFEIGDIEKLEYILYKDINFSQTQDEDFYYQLLAMISILKNDYDTAIENFKLALDFAEKSSSFYALSIIYLNIAVCHTLNNSILKAMEHISKAEFLINSYSYFYWKIVKDITTIKINLLNKDIPLRKILREVHNLLPIVKNNHYFLLEIEIYAILVEIYKSLNSNQFALSYFKTYQEKVYESIKQLPEYEQKIYIKRKKANINDFKNVHLCTIVLRSNIKSSEWNKQILPLLRLEDTERIKFFLNKKISDYFCPFSYAIIIINTNNIANPKTQNNKNTQDNPQTNKLLEESTKTELQSTPSSYFLSNYSIYLQDNFDSESIENSQMLELIRKSIENDKTISLKHNSKHTLISPILLKTSKIGFLIIQDAGEMPFSTSEIKMVHQFSYHLSTMLIRLSEFDEVNQKVELMRKLMEVTSKMMKEYDLEKIEYELVKEIINISNAKRGFLIKKDKSGNYYFSVALDDENQVLNNASNFSKTTVSEVQTTKHPVFITNYLDEVKKINLDNYEQNEDIGNLYLKSNINDKGELNSFYTKHSYTTLDNQANSLYCAPIIIDNEIYALLYLDNLGEKKSNLKIRNDMMNMFLMQVSLALNNAKTYQSLMTKNWELHTLDSMKNDFISVVSHELNTPLITLQGYIQRLKKNVDPIDIETSDLLLKVDKSTKKLIATIQDIMSLNRYNSSTKLKLEKYDLTETLKGIYYEAELLSKQRKMRLNLEIEEELPLVEIDWQSFHIMILNIMMNAIRFTADYGSITLGARKATFPHEKIDEIDKDTNITTSKDSIIIYIQDNGIGIPEHEHDNVFKAFYEIGDIYSHRSGFLEFRSGGLGIGLAISKRIVELHQGKIWLKSKEREGTTVFISVPIPVIDETNNN